MWGKQHKTWIKYRRDITATDVATAIFLSKYLKHCTIHKTYIPSLEVIDLQRYKVINKSTKLKVALQERTNIPFIFVVGKN